MDFTNGRPNDEQYLESIKKDELSTLQSRRSANYKPNIWKYDLLQSLTSEYNEDTYKGQAHKLKEEVLESIFVENLDPLAKLELIDSIEKLGLASLFEEEIKEALNFILAICNNHPSIKEDLYATSLCFRILRQHGYFVSQDMFIGFIDETGKIKKSTRLNLKATIELFEASNLAIEDEKILEEAKKNSCWDLKTINLNIDDKLSKRVARALELPLQWRVEWYNVRRHIHEHEKVNHTNSILMKLAKLNFNMVQATHQGDLKEISRWNNDGTQNLPHCMKICLQTLYDTTYEIASEIEEEKGWNPVLPHLQKVWADFCKALLMEAKWYNKGYTPSLQEYLNNGWISCSGPILSLHAFFSVTNMVGKELTNSLQNNQDLVYYSSLIIRLCNDQATTVAEQERGDAPSSIICFMREENISEVVARKYIRGLIMNAWKKLNKECIIQFPLLQPFVKCVTNTTRVAHFIYQNGDGFGVQDHETRDQVLSLLIEPLVYN